VQYSGGSVNGSKYVVIDKAMTFYGAQDQCRKHGGYLAHVNSIREQLFLEQFLTHELHIHGNCNATTCAIAKQCREAILATLGYREFL